MRQFRHPRSIVLRVLAVALALITARVVATDLATLHRRAGDLGPLVTTIEARRDLPFGTVVRARDLRTVERNSSLVPDGQLRARDDAVGRTVIVPVVSGSPLFASHLSEHDRASTAELLGADRVGVRVDVTDGFAPAVGSFVRVFAVSDPGVGVASGSRVVANRARVLAHDGDDGSRRGVMLEVTADEAADLAFATAHGVVALALLAPEDACCESSP